MTALANALTGVAIVSLAMAAWIFGGPWGVVAFAWASVTLSSRGRHDRPQP